MMSTPTAPSWVRVAGAGAIAALSFAIPVVDDGLMASEVLGILLAGIVGTGWFAAAAPAYPDRAGRLEARRTKAAQHRAAD